MHTYKLTLAYDGTHYVGWQVQSNGVSIQSVLQSKLELIQKAPVNVTGAGRTDSGVHASGQTAHVQFEKPWDLYRLKHALNSMLPSDIRVIEIEEMHESFHARYSATGKIYTYHFCLEQVQNPFRCRYAWHLPYPSFSLDKMEEGAQKLLGTHDFKGFACTSANGIAARDSIRTLKCIEIVPGEEIAVHFEGDGFLYKMVRNLMGTLVDIGRGARPLAIIDQVFSEKERVFAGQAAPAKGLCLRRVLY